MPLLGHSPLGLVGAESLPKNLSKNFVDNYNDRRSAGNGNISLFSGNRIVRPFELGIGGKDSGYNNEFTNTSSLHSNDVYDTSIQNIINRLKDTKASLSYMDFAYLKDVGVFPNNRLMIARRFATPQQDNIMYNVESDIDRPLVTLISWKPQGEDFLEISFGEEWTDADASFEGILNDAGGDFGSAFKKLGTYMGQGANAIPLPGSTETFQRKILAKIGILDDTEEQKNQIPEGNPNLIKEAKQRKLIEAGKPGSGLTCDVTIKMQCVWEQKFIEGIDPTLAWMDIISMVGRFGTSTSQTYGLSKNLSNSVIKNLKDPDHLITKIIESLKESVSVVISKVKEVIKNLPKNVSETASEVVENPKEVANKLVDSVSSSALAVVENVKNTIVKKYRERIIGVANALSGLPSTPWHVTLGNPLRPVFCSGDMLTTKVSLKLGPNLSFNDLPTTITADFDLKNARPWGLQEIMAKFNSGYIRTLSYSQDDKGKLDGQVIGDFSLTGDKKTEFDANKLKSEKVESDVNLPTSNNITPTTPSVDFFPSDDLAVNPDPNSSLPNII